MKRAMFVKFNSIKELKNWLAKFTKDIKVDSVLELFAGYKNKNKN